MSFRSLIQWLQVTDLDLAHHEQALAMVEAALEDLDEQEDEDSFEALRTLVPIYNGLLKGSLPADGLREYGERHLEVLREGGEPYGVLLERELRQMAQDLAEPEWRTSSYEKIAWGIDEFLEGRPEPLAQAVAELEAVMEEAWEPYYHTPVADSEVTAESVVGHRILMDGIQGWIDALTATRSAAYGEATWEDAVQAAEQANRLLVAVQKFSERIERETQFAGP